MFFRFACAIAILTGISLVGIAIEKQNLSLKRRISLRQYEIERLNEKRCRLILQTEELGAPLRLLDESSSTDVSKRASRSSTGITPLLEWRQQSTQSDRNSRGEGIDGQ